jgi:hypothetical protein
MSPLITTVTKSSNESSESNGMSNNKILANSPNKTVSIAPFNSNANNNNNSNNTPTKSQNNNVTDSPKLDDDVTKQKRIEHITKLLKTDLIESFKTVTSDSQNKNPNSNPNSNNNS